MVVSSATTRRLGVVLALLLLTLAVYGPVVRYPFTGLDDDVVITHNPWVNEGLSVGGLRWAFTTLAGTMWFPLTWISYMADVQFFGRGPGSHHLANLLLHAAGSILLFLVLGALTGSRWKSAFVSALFAIHPLHVESVVWITERKDVLSGLFWMVTLAAYLRYAHRPGPGRYLLLLGVFVLGLMTKPMLVTIPFVLLLLDWWPLGRFRDIRGAAPAAPGRVAGLLAEKLPLLAVAAGFSLLTLVTQGRGDAIGSLDAIPLWARLANAVLSYAWYVRKTLLPSALAIYYPHPGTAFAPAQIVAAVVFIAGATWFVLRSRAQRPALAVGWLWYLGTLVPTLGLVQVGAYARADRFTYLPLIGLFLLAAWGVPDLFLRRPRLAPLLPWLGGAVTLLAAAACSLQVGYWRDDETLFGHALAVTQRNWMIHGNLGVTLLEQGRIGEARHHFEEALKYNPNYGLARLNLGQALSRQGRGDEAERQFLEVLRQNPQDGRAHFCLGRYLAQSGRLDAALRHLSEAVRLEPEFAAAYESLGWALLRAGRHVEALGQFRALLALDPDSAAAFDGAGAALGEAGRFDEAAASLRAALRLDPGNAAIRDNLAFVLERLGKQEEADRERQEAARLRGGQQ